MGYSTDKDAIGYIGKQNIQYRNNMKVKDLRQEKLSRLFILRFEKWVTRGNKRC